MTELFLNGRLAVIDKDSKFKIVFDNPYFTKSSTYTNDITLPLRGCIQNQLIFKHINRGDVHKESQTLSAILVSNNKVLVKGTALIREVTEERVQVQLLSGNSEMNFFVSGEKYIDEFNLGYAAYWPNTFVPVSSAHRYFGDYPTCSCVWHPIYNESADEIYNRLAANYANESGTDVEGFTFYGPVYYQWCVQPYLCFIIKKIIQATGYTLITNQIESTIFKNLYICNATKTLLYADVLPHWTINEFFTQVERFLGVVTVVDEGSKTVRLLFGHDFFDHSEPVHLKNVLRSFTVTIDEEETTDLSNANIGYSLSNSDALMYKKLSTETMNAATLRTYNSLSDLKSAYNGMDEYNRKRSIFEAEGQQFIHYIDGSTGKLKEVNQFRDLIRNSDKTDLDIELKIVPVGTVPAEIEVYAKGSVVEKNLLWRTEAAIPSMQGGIYQFGSDADFSIQGVIEGETDEKYKPDIIQVAFNEGRLQVMAGPKGETHRYPMAFTDYADDACEITYNFPHWSLRLHGNAQSIGGAIFDKAKKINTTAEEVKKFMSNEIYDPKSVFIIENKKYVCKKIEVECDAKGISPLQEVTVYELSS